MNEYRPHLARRHIDRIILPRASRLEDTPQGYLWCRDVPLARTGTMEYGLLEVPIPALPGSRSVIVERTEDEVFSPEAIESFRGMPLTDDHPDDDVTVSNWREHNVGDIHNPRRGEGEHADCLVGDLLVKDPDVIAKIKSREKRELSCGYDAQYTDIRPGYGRQINIRGNHVSLVDAGRAGSRIAIRDRRDRMTEKKPRLKLRDALIKFFRAKDEAEREAVVKAMEDGDASDDEPSRGDGHHTTINIHGAPAGDDKKSPTPAADEKAEPSPRDEAADNPTPGAGKDMDEDKVKEICGATLAEALDAKLRPVMQAITDLGARLDATDTKADEANQKADAVVEAVEDMTDPEDMATQDAVARAEVLNPGAKAPVTDSKPGSKSHRDALVAYQRQTLIDAFAKSEDAREAIRDAYGVATPDFKKMLPAEVGIVFRAASSAVAATRDAASAPEAFTFAPRHFDGAERKVKTPAEINADMRARWKR